MDFGAPPERIRPEAVLPVINLVFLLLIFFLISATLSQPEPVTVEPPVADGTGPLDAGPDRLSLSRDGTLAWGQARGAEALAALVASLDPDNPHTLALHADGAAPASAVAAVVRDLAASGITDIWLIAEPAQ
jgi:biopolymer transport protein ExbD